MTLPNQRRLGFPRARSQRFITPEQRLREERNLAWPGIVLAEPQRYGALLTELACRLRHRTGNVHPAQPCPLCTEQTKQEAA